MENKAMNQNQNKTSIYKNYNRLRSHTARIDVDSKQCILKVEGEFAMEVLNIALPGKIFYLQPFASIQSPVLDQNGKIIDVVQILHLESHYLIFVSPSSKTKVIEIIQNSIPKNDSESKLSINVDNSLKFKISDISNTTALLAYEGPYSWKILKEIVGPDLLGLRVNNIMSFSFKTTEAFCLRSGWSGEYGYRIIVTRDLDKEIINTINSIDDIPLLSDLELKLLVHEVNSPVLGVSVHPGDCPFEMGLRYMIDFQKMEFQFSEALSNSEKSYQYENIVFEMQDPVSNRIAHDVLKEEKYEIEQFQPILSENVEFGRSHFIQYSPIVNKWIGHAKIKKEYAFPGNYNFEILNSNLTFRSSPLVQTLSRQVSME